MFEKQLLSTLIFFFIFISLRLPVTSSLKHKKEKCTKIDDCKCVFPDGTAYDLSNLNGQTFGWVNLTNNYALYFTPCKDTVIDASGEKVDCNIGTGVTMCLRNDKRYFSLGFAENSKFITKGNAFKTVALQFEKENESERNSVTINLVCDVAVMDSYLKQSPNSKLNDFELDLISPESCLKSIITPSKPALLTDDDDDSMSTGSRLVIMFLFISVLYFGGGILALKFIRGAEGKEMIPNYEFWADLPYLVRDGILFTLSGCQASPSYDRI